MTNLCSTSLSGCVSAEEPRTSVSQSCGSRVSTADSSVRQSSSSALSMLPLPVSRWETMACTLSSLRCGSGCCFRSHACISCCCASSHALSFCTLSPLSSRKASIVVSSRCKCSGERTSLVEANWPLRGLAVDLPALTKPVPSSDSSSAVAISSFMRTVEYAGALGAEGPMSGSEAASGKPNLLAHQPRCSPSSSMIAAVANSEKRR
mmetsp:Transcript_1744/g.3658  ORF Transcript_1744/g.3658 Transcript_1744/m.3658 type:complete len:207 (-) Transcript_1744:708-1328(-)